MVSIGKDATTMYTNRTKKTQFVKAPAKYISSSGTVYKPVSNYSKFIGSDKFVGVALGGKAMVKTDYKSGRKFPALVWGNLVKSSKNVRVIGNHAPYVLTKGSKVYVAQ